MILLITVKAMAVRQGMEDSDVATFTYTVGGTVGIAGAKTDLRLDVVCVDGSITVSGADGGTVRYCGEDVKDCEKTFKEKPWERQILANEKDPNFRVFNLTVSPFNDATTSYRLKSIGGYSAAKLRRYQDIIEQHLAKMHQPVIDMLNTKYFIVPDNANGNAPVVQFNPGAMGNAWFVADAKVVNTPNEECDALMQVDLHSTAVIGQDFAQYAIGHNNDSTATVRLTSYAPNRLEYEAQNAEKATLVFSEIYYPYGWKAYVDDKETDIFRVNYLLRAINVEPGSHHIRMEFVPDSVRRGNILSMVFVVLMYGIILFCIGKGARDWYIGQKHTAE